MTSLHNIPHSQVPSERPFNVRVYYLSEVSPHLQRGAVNRLTVHAIVPLSGLSSGSQRLPAILSVLSDCPSSCLS